MIYQISPLESKLDNETEIKQLEKFFSDYAMVIGGHMPGGWTLNPTFNVPLDIFVHLVFTSKSVCVNALITFILGGSASALIKFILHGSSSGKTFPKSKRIYVCCLYYH